MAHARDGATTRLARLKARQGSNKTYVGKSSACMISDGACIRVDANMCSSVAGE